MKFSFTGDYIRRQRKCHQSRMCSFVYVNLQLQAAIPNKDWVKKFCSWRMLTKSMKNKFEKNNIKKKILFKVLFRFFHYKSFVHVLLFIEGVLSIGNVLLFCVHFTSPRIFHLFTYNYKLI